MLPPSGASAWYELFPKSGNGPVVGVPLPMIAGDVVALKLQFTPNHTSITFTWNNLTAKQSVTRTLAQAGGWYNGSTAERIVERAGFDGAYDSPYLAHFTPITFTNAVSSTPTSVRNAFPNTYTATMFSKYVNSAYHPLTRVAPGGNAQSFTTTWLASH